MKKATKTKGALSLEIVPANDQDRLMGEQLTLQFQRATGGAREVLIFGAMMMQLRERIISTRGNDDGSIRTGGADSKDSGMKAWIAQNAPKVSLSSAYRFEAVSNAIETEFGLPKTLERKISFPALVTTTEEKLSKIDRRLPAKQREAFKMAEGTSQKSWLDKFTQTSRGGKTYERTEGKGLRRRLSQREFVAAVRKRVTGMADELMDISKQELFRILSDSELDLLIDEADALAVKARTWRAKTKTERDEINRAQLARLVKKL
jgi:hypothetical protein